MRPPQPPFLQRLLSFENWKERVLPEAVKAFIVGCVMQLGPSTTISLICNPPPTILQLQLEHFHAPTTGKRSGEITRYLTQLSSEESGLSMGRWLYEMASRCAFAE
ncbi:Hypothetical predicted protein [Lecanosticta acicola]|uniref:Uncharacterized protein n=1 Tax=Lecanosticta acicola TaxID=111012 RepID=A0AAI8YX63_9PEZI|nr:Hypothetical predicted protein [Lecanosticta acicola]